MEKCRVSTLVFSLINSQGSTFRLVSEKNANDAKNYSLFFSTLEMLRLAQKFYRRRQILNKTFLFARLSCVLCFGSKLLYLNK